MLLLPVFVLFVCVGYVLVCVVLFVLCCMFVSCVFYCVCLWCCFVNCFFCWGGEGYAVFCVIVLLLLLVFVSCVLCSCVCCLMPRLFNAWLFVICVGMMVCLFVNCFWGSVVFVLLCC